MPGAASRRRAKKTMASESKIIYMNSSGGVRALEYPEFVLGNYFHVCLVIALL